MSVYKAISAVQADLCKSGIGKTDENKFDNYKFRGIDSVYNALSPLLAKHGLCMLPRVLSRICEERVSQKGGALFYVTVDMEFDLVCSEDGSKHTVKTYGEAMDRGDKATNKAMSAAYKYAAFQTFAIPTEGDNDADNQTHEVAPLKTATEQWEEVNPAQMDILRELAADVVALIEKGKDGPAAAQMIRDQNLDNEQKLVLWNILKPHSAVRAAIKKAEAEARAKA